MTWKLKASTDAGSVTVLPGIARGISDRPKQLSQAAGLPNGHVTWLTLGDELHQCHE